jgi:flagellar biosynthesis/type III secretory pathway chaperone
MEKLLNALNDCVDRQLNLYRKLRDLFNAERNAVLASDLEELNRVLMDKELLLQNIRKAEHLRRQTAHEMAVFLGMEDASLTISQLGERVGEPYASAIKQKGARLQTLIDEIQVVSERNRSLCLQALQFVSGSIKLLTALSRPNPVYHATGRIHNERYTGRMLSGAV